ncbi:DUF5946 family protein [Sphingomonas bacterium]|uniref:DUF5946 family protein n=1 Tax=Sphingomonas bacterium TaxID=1895847 RepID=UPI00157754A0|nr:DUF5946 family protein [Sphingomonas bacterium]
MSTLNGSGVEICPDCGVALPFCDGSPHPYLGASASCWALYGHVLAREYQQAALMTIHRLTVDAYAAQHPGKPERRSIQSVWVHLAGLYLVVDRSLAPEFARRVIGALATQSEQLTWLTPPAQLGAITVAHVAAAEQPADHINIVQNWAGSVWAAWKIHHPAIITLVDRMVRHL